VGSAGEAVSGAGAPSGADVSSAALSGVRVIEVAHVMAGPACGVLLGDMGADVVKVERLPAGDVTRGYVPPAIDGHSAAFMMMNRGKRGVALKLRSAEGLDVLRRLFDSADVVIESFRPGTMEKMGLGYEELVRSNPRLVYCQISGFGRTGPLAHQGGFDLIAQGYSGLMSITGEGPGRAPLKVGAPITDITAGILAAMGVVAALFERERTGRGQRVDTSLYEAGITHTFWQSAIALATGVSPGAMGTAHPLAAPYQAFRTADGWINVGASNENTWARLAAALEASELTDDPRFATNRDRWIHREELAGLLEPHFRSRTTAAWLSALEEAGVPAGPVSTITEMLAHPQTLARGMVCEVEHTALGAVKTLGTPVKLSGTRGSEEGGADGATPPCSASPARGAPLLGEHTREVLAERGFPAEEIDRLIAEGVVRQAAV
jgi:Predicted acyl-CoA transferases/carnitine dehydratase